MSLQVGTEKIGTTLVVRLAGELDHHTAELVRDRVEQELDKGVCRNLIFTLEQLVFMDSSGLGVILGRYKRISQLGGRMSLCAVNDSMRKLFELSGILKILPVYDTETRALTEMGEV
ncbi:anti-sigma F factor antagonist [Effusibacillus lacus]|uniref:Anti-sigma F factor antagonist n=1 Tax=Effusibacillus lacus TaxID=1348429 RepID=A0A292YSF4_9BACL|nr:anti-sigma F factor antagonist [Effusibacillus lacus]TCS76313.1 SpoIIAA-like anti-anti-sigma regulatory factor [Effusibacillus lacus]GAX91859.1 anti-sigma F factor antagonist [Effusibacillus lacus]